MLGNLIDVMFGGVSIFLAAVFLAQNLGTWAGVGWLTLFFMVIVLRYYQLKADGEL